MTTVQRLLVGPIQALLQRVQGPLSSSLQAMTGDLPSTLLQMDPLAAFQTQTHLADQAVQTGVAIDMNPPKMGMLVDMGPIPPADELQTACHLHHLKAAPIRPLCTDTK